ncbi:type VI secretion system contractile sheath large subunit [Labrenzia sp. PHM005]|uniref:type VI secretion system contractile sheath large subunit n=1 Tax=Labrenzia sp. PHM005 TaxID=2590016 RepID=UPI00113FE58B|nr:type VI secretion system contractile sheath large subunit [Labrenzia sp. PHM005]QDG77461.1 type VI secretion system contractile sheath large subunit [Labrenzia sp. PHM005]
MTNPDTNAQTQGAPAGGAVTEKSPEEFASILKQNFRIQDKNDTANKLVDNAMSTFLEEAMADQTLIKDDVYDTIDEMIAKLDSALTDQVNEIIHAPEYQKLESAWRGIDYLVHQSETDASLKLHFLNISKNELAGVFKSYRGAKWDQSPLFKQIYEAEFGQLGGQPYGCLVGDYEFSNEPQDITILRGMAKISAAAHAPFLAAANPKLMQMESWTELPAKRDLSKVFDTELHAQWRTLRESEDARYLGLSLPRVLARQPYGAKSDPVEEFAFEEEFEDNSHDNYGWMNSAYAMAANINRAYKEYGWTVRIRGVESGGLVEELPTHVFETDDGGVDQKCPAEVAITDRREHEISRLGLIPLIHRKNTDQAAFLGAQSVFKPRQFSGPDGKDATASDNLSARLPYMFATTRFAHYLKVMVRNKIGSTKEAAQLQRWLNDWIMDYVDGDPDNSTEETKARKPLREAKVTIIDDEENPGYYRAQFFLRPHYQLEGMDIGMSLASRIPQDAS